MFWCTRKKRSRIGDLGKTHATIKRNGWMDEFSLGFLDHRYSRFAFCKLSARSSLSHIRPQHIHTYTRVHSLYMCLFIHVVFVRSVSPLHYRTDAMQRDRETPCDSFASAVSLSLSRLTIRERTARSMKFNILHPAIVSRPLCSIA